jgi:hypothetical protein
MYQAGETISPARNHLIPRVNRFSLHRCILLLEDLDAAFTRSVSRDATSTGTPTAATSSTSTTENNDGSTLSLSGLLNSLDGVAAAEGRYVDIAIDFALF